MAHQDCGIENLGEFDEAQDMSTRFCRPITEEEYENQTSAETEKALTELCAFLQENPEAYYQVLRRKKQEEMENGGVFSYLKVKMMSLMHGERYPACLVSPEHSVKQLTQLKEDMHKAFAYSEESKGRRYSKRVAARSEGNPDKENTPLLTQKPLQRTRLHSPNTTPTTISHSSRSLRSAAKKTQSPAGLGQTAPPVMAVLPNKMSATASNAPCVPPPPPPPPPPPVPPQSKNGVSGGTRNGFPGGMKMQHSTSSVRKKRAFNDSDGSARHVGLLAWSPPKLSPLIGICSKNTQQVSVKRISGGKGTGGTADAVERSDVTPSGSAPSSPSDSEFVTPESDVPVPKKRHKRTLSNTSTGSTNSLTSIHSELISSNPLTRLRSTRVARSPGGTPLRSPGRSRMPQEPLHRALVTVLREKFKNVRTPSPLAAHSSTSVFSPDLNSRNTSLNCTFSP